jgi:hypothetical protein
MPVTLMLFVLAAAEEEARAQNTAAVPKAQAVVLVVGRLAAIAGAAFAEDINIAALGDRGRVYPCLDGDGVTVVEVKQAGLAGIGDTDEPGLRGIKARGAVGGGNVLELPGPSGWKLTPPSALPTSGAAPSKVHWATGSGSAAGREAVTAQRARAGRVYFMVWKTAKSYIRCSRPRFRVRPPHFWGMATGEGSCKAMLDL